MLDESKPSLIWFLLALVPRTTAKASTMMDLPLPVSPEIAENPSLKSRFNESIIAKSFIYNLLSICSPT